MHAVAEIWRTIDRFPSYQVSNLGRVMRIAGRWVTGRPKTQKPDRDGYMHADLWEGGIKYQNPAVHVLVLETFVGPKPTPAHEGAHWDGDPANNVLVNLRWATPKENAADKIRHGRQPHLFGEDSGAAKLTDLAVADILQCYAAGQSAQTLATRHGVVLGTVHRVARGDTWPHIDSPWRDAAKGRRLSRKLTVDEDQAVAARYAGGEDPVRLAAVYGVHQATIYRAVERSLATSPMAVKIRERLARSRRYGATG